MRKNINILWLDDLNSKDFTLKRMRKSVENILSSKGYKGNIIPLQTFDEAYEKLSTNERIDFFISDYNLDSSNDGIKYLKEIRNKKGYKQFVILYSNNDTSVIKNQVIKYLNETNMNIFSNFTFFSSSTGNSENEFARAIDVILCRWDELNALRGLYMSENAELEHMLKERLIFQDGATYKNLVDQCYREKIHRNQKPKMKQLFDKWEKLLEERNALAHVDERYDKEKGYYLIGKGYDAKEFTIYESELDEYRKYLMNDVDEIKQFLQTICLKK